MRRAARGSEQRTHRRDISLRSQLPLMPNVQGIIDNATSGTVCPCVVGVGIHEPDESPPFYHKAPHRFQIPGLAEAVSALEGMPTLTDADLELTRSGVDALWQSAIFEYTCPGMSGAVDEYVLILEQVHGTVTYDGRSAVVSGWHAYFDLLTDPKNCDLRLNWHITTWTPVIPS